MARTHSARKEKKTFSLSRESVRYLQSVQKRKKSDSISAVLEDLIQQQRQAQEMQRISASITSYYDSLSDEQVADDRAWGQFAETQFPTEE
jgi:hypothetical protein